MPVIEPAGAAPVQPAAAPVEQEHLTAGGLGRYFKACWLDPTATIMDNPPKALTYSIAVKIVALFIALINSFAAGLIAGASVMLIDRVFIMHHEMFTDQLVDTFMQMQGNLLKKLLGRNREPAQAQPTE